MAIDVLYELSGVANGAPLLITGTGEVDPAAGTYDLDIVIPHFPMGWDPATIILICCDKMLGFGAKETLGAQNLHSRCGTDYTILDRSGEGRVQSGRVLFRARASSIGGMHGGKLVNRSQIHEATFNMLPEERITHIETPYDAIVRRLSNDTLLMTSAFHFDTNHEKDCHGFTNYPIVTLAMKSLESSCLAIVTVDSISFKTAYERNGTGSMSLHVESSVKETKI